MNDLTISLNVLCAYVNKKRSVINNINNQQIVSYKDFSGQCFGSFKSNDKYKKDFELIKKFVDDSEDILSKEITINHLPNIIGRLLLSSDKSLISDVSFIVLSDLINGVQIGVNSITTELKTELDALKNELLNQFNNGPAIIDGTQTIASTLTNTVVNTDLANLQHSAAVHPNSSVNMNTDMSDISSLLRQIMKDVNDLKTLNNTNKIAENKQTGAKKTNFTRNELNELRQSIYIRYERKIKLENTIAMFKSHHDNDTVPPALGFVKFPSPLWKDDAIFVDEHNEIIRQAQKMMVVAIIERGKTLVDCLNSELNNLRIDLDSSYDGNKDKFFDNVKATVNNDLKHFLEASNAKLLRLQNNYFEDKINTVYELQDSTPEDYFNSYLDLNNEIIDLQNKNKSIDNSKEMSKKSNQSLSGSAHGRGSYVKRNHNYRRRTNVIENNWRHDMQNNNTAYNSNHNNTTNNNFNNSTTTSSISNVNNKQNNNNKNQQKPTYNLNVPTYNQPKQQHQNFQISRNQNTKP